MEVTSEDVSVQFAKLKSVSRIAACCFAALTALAAIFAVAALVVIAFTATSAHTDGESALSYIPACVQMVILPVILGVCTSLFKCIGQGVSPFNSKQARNMRIIGWLFVVYALCDNIANNASISSVIAGTPVSVDHQDTPFFGVNIFMLAIGVVFFCFSAIFKYGSLLQEVSDDTI